MRANVAPLPDRLQLVASYTYDAQGRRIVGPQHEYVYDLAGNAITMLDKNNGV